MQIKTILNRIQKQRGFVYGPMRLREQGGTLTRISDLAMVLYRQDKSPRLDFWGSDVRSHTTEGDTLWVNYKPRPFSSPSMAF